MVKTYVKLRRRQAELIAEHDGIKEQANELQTELLAEFGNDGIQKLTVDGSTVFLHRQVWVSTKEGKMGEAVKALQDNGLGHFVKESFSTQTLSAHYRELEREEEQLPAELADCVNVVETYSVRVRRS